MGVDAREIVLQAVVEVLIPDPQGRNNKARPVIVVGFDDSDTSIFVYCAISTTFTEPLPSKAIKLPYDLRRGGHPATGLNKPSVAVCDWVNTAQKSDIIKKWGYLPSSVFRRVVARIEQLADEEPT